jgi:hypothetical protein
MSSLVSVLNDRLLELGWNVSDIVDPSVTIQGFDLPVAHIHTQRGLLRANIIVIQPTSDEKTKALLAKFVGFSNMSSSVVRRRGARRDWELRVEIRDAQRAIDELNVVAQMQPEFGTQTYEETLLHFENRGWRMRRNHSALADDDAHWSIRAERAGDVLELYTSHSTGAPAEPQADALFNARLRMSTCDVHALLRSRHEAEKLCGDLLSGV